MSLGTRWRSTDRALRALLAVTAVGLLARLVLLGDRVQHFDEARVAWWTLELMRTGTFEYRPIIHGPFVQHVNSAVFAAIGPTDFASRLVVALVGGLLPLVAYLFREHLRDAELVAVAGFLAFNPLLLYYSRFFRSSVLVAAFMTVAFGLVVRFADTRRPRYAHLAAVFVALGFAAKENAVIYLLCWLGAGGLALALTLYARPDGRTGVDRVRSFVGGLERPGREALLRAAGHLALGVGLFLAVLVFFYAPRGGETGLYQAIANPGRLPGTLDAMAASLEDGFRYWFGHASEPGCHKENVVAAYLCFLGLSLEALAGYAAPLMAFAFLGTAVEHFAAERPRALVLVTAYWGFVSVFGYPFGTDVFGAWIMVNALVPLAVPAGVGLAVVYRYGRDAARDDDRVSLAVAVALLLLVGGQMAAVGVTSSYIEPTADDNELVQYAQPSQDWRATLTDVARLSRDREGTDVLFVGGHLVDGADEARRTPACVAWFKALPLPWYLEKDGVDVACAGSVDAIGDAEPPPVVIAHADERAALAARLGPGYEVRTHHLRTVGDETVVFVRE